MYFSHRSRSCYSLKLSFIATSWSLALLHVLSPALLVLVPGVAILLEGLSGHGHLLRHISAGDTLCWST